MRVLLSIHHELNQNSGAPGATVNLAHGLRELGHEVDLLSFDDFRQQRGRRKLFPWFVAAHLLRHPRYDVLDLSSDDGWVFASIRRLLGKARTAPLLAARSHGLEHVAHGAHRQFLRETGQRVPARFRFATISPTLWQCARSFRKADLAFFLNGTDRDYAVDRLRVDAARAVVTTNGIAPGFIDRAQVLLHDPASRNNARNVAFIGSYEPRKGIDVLREAMSAILEKRPDVRLCYFGTGAKPERILDTYPAAVRNQVSVVQRYSNAELPDLLAEFGILAFPSLSEGLALAPLEAMASGLVPVVTSIPGAQESVQAGRSGMVVPPRDPVALQRAIEQVLDDGVLWRSLRQEALRRASRQDWLQVAAATADTYRRFDTA